MMDARTDLLTTRLKELQGSSLDIEGALITNAEGFMTASVLPATTDEKHLIALATRLFSTAQRSVKELDRGGLSEVYVMGSEGYILMRSIRENILLVVLARKDANPELVLSALRTAAAELKEVVDYGTELIPGRPLKQDISLDFIYVDPDLAQIKDEHFIGYLHIFKSAEIYGDFELIILCERGKAIGCEELHHGFVGYGEKVLERLFEVGNGYLDIFELTEGQLEVSKKKKPEALFNKPLALSEIFIPEVYLELGGDKYVVGDKLVAKVRLKTLLSDTAQVQFSIVSPEKGLLGEEKSALLPGEGEKEYKVALKNAGSARVLARVIVGNFERIVEKEIEVRPLDFQLTAKLDKDAFMVGEVVRCIATTKISNPEYLAGRALWMTFRLFMDGKLLEERKREVTIQKESVLDEYFKLEVESGGYAILTVTTSGSVEKSVELLFEIINLKAALELEKKDYNVGEEFRGILNIGMTPTTRRDVKVSFSLIVGDEEIFSEANTIGVEGNARMAFRRVVEKAGKANAVATLSFDKLKKVVETPFEILPLNFKLSAGLDKEVYVVGEELRCVAKLVIPEHFRGKRLKIAFKLFLNDALLETLERGVLASGWDHVEEFRTVLNTSGSALVVVSAQGQTVKLPLKIKEELFEVDGLSMEIKRMLKDEGLEHLIAQKSKREMSKPTEARMHKAAEPRIERHQ
ncbi:MAG: hypothetical protein EFT35_08170 [Methanophagales archaeon ANME-1-THS]|nr:MAG: hypothetical protein EFT35_08170 [Methanophagales archaeon ANME-1-THS]